jgi:hypothetical protein
MPGDPLQQTLPARAASSRPSVTAVVDEVADSLHIEIATIQRTGELYGYPYTLGVSVAGKKIRTPSGGMWSGIDHRGMRLPEPVAESSVPWGVPLRWIACSSFSRVIRPLPRESAKSRIQKPAYAARPPGRTRGPPVRLPSRQLPLPGQRVNPSARHGQGFEESPAAEYARGGGGSRRRS